MVERITFRSEIYLEGEDRLEILQKFERLPLWSEDAKIVGADFLEIVSVEEMEEQS